MPDTPAPLPPDELSKQRRAHAAPEEVEGVTFRTKGLTPERLQALRQFLEHATADEIASIRKMYGDMPEVLRMIGLEYTGDAIPEEQHHR